MSLKDKIYTEAIGIGEYEGLLKANDVKTSALEYYKWLTDNVDYMERDRLFNKFKEIFGDWNK